VSVAQAETAHLDTVKANVLCEAFLNSARATHDQAKVRFAAQQEAAIELRKQLNSARDLDAQLVPLVQQCEQSKVASATASQDYELADSRQKTKLNEKARFVEQLFWCSYPGPRSV
jgi:hypothetical protein